MYVASVPGLPRCAHFNCAWVENIENIFNVFCHTHNGKGLELRLTQMHTWTWYILSYQCVYKLYIQ